MNQVGLSQQYADGGMVGLGGQPQQQSPMLALRYADGGQVGQQPGMQPGAGGQPMDGKQMDLMVQDAVRQNPQGVQQMRQIIQQLMSSGQLTPQELHMAVQLAQSVIHNPQLWPQLRQFAIQQGLVGPNDLPQQYDPAIPMTILVVARSMEGGGGGGGDQQQPGMQMPQQGGQAPGGQYADGGMIVGPGTGRSDSINTTNQSTGQPVKVSNGEYIIPSHVVEAKGKDFFDSLLRKYAPLQQGGGQ